MADEWPALSQESTLSPLEFGDYIAGMESAVSELDDKSAVKLLSPVHDKDTVVISCNKRAQEQASR